MDKLHQLISSMIGRTSFRQIRQRWREYRQGHQMRRFYAALIKPGDLVFDVGANVGSRSQIFLELGARVVAVEPQKDCARTLFLRFGANPSFHLVNKALGAAEGQAEMFIGNTNLVTTLNTEWLSEIRSNHLFPKLNWQEKKLVSVTTLDHLIHQYGLPAYIKIDAECYEHEILRGLTTPIPLISFEFHPKYPEPAQISIDLLSGLGSVQMNYIFGEWAEWQLGKWISPEEMKKQLAQAKLKPKLYYGDIFARNQPNDAGKP